jgi:hypothetical protein
MAATGKMAIASKLVMVMYAAVDQISIAFAVASHLGKVFQKPNHTYAP